MITTIYRNEKAYIPFTVKLTEPIATTIEQICKDNHCSKSDTIRTAIKYWLDNEVIPNDLPFT